MQESTRHRPENAKEAVDEDSEPSFAKLLYKNLEDPSSYTESEDSKRKDLKYQQNDIIKLKKHDELRAFFCLDL